MSLYTKILLFFVALVVLLSVVTTYSGIHSIERIAVNELENGLTSDINLFSFSVDREFYQMETRLRQLATHRPLREAVCGGTTDRIREVFADLVDRENIDVLHLADNRMRPIVTLRSRAGPSHHDTAGRFPGDNQGFHSHRHERRGAARPLPLHAPRGS